MVFGKDVVINIDGTDYSTRINNFTETGGEKQYTTIKTFGNNYKKTYIGRSDYTVSFNMKCTDTEFQTLLDIESPVDIEITLGTESKIYYYNMLPISNNMDSGADDLIMGKILFSAPAYDKTNTRWNRKIE